MRSAHRKAYSTPGAVSNSQALLQNRAAFLIYSLWSG